MTKESQLFLDSGAFTLYYNEAIKKKRGMGIYKSDDFWFYVDQYAKFIKHPRFRDKITLSLLSTLGIVPLVGLKSI